MWQRPLGSTSWWATVEYPDLLALPAVWVTYTIYVTTDNNKMYRWNWVGYDELSSGSWWDMTKVEYDTDNDWKVEVAEEAEKVDAWTF